MITVEQAIKWIEDRYTFSENHEIVCKNAWQTLKAAVLTQQTNNKQSTPCEHTFTMFGGSVKCDKCGVVFPCHW